MNRQHAYHVRRVDTTAQDLQKLLNDQASKGYKLQYTRHVGRMTDLVCIFFNETVFTMMEHDWIHREVLDLADTVAATNAQERSILMAAAADEPVEEPQASQQPEPALSAG